MSSRSAPIRVPAITAWFWIVKILTTGAGETTSDFLGQRLGHVRVAEVGALALISSFVLQFRMHRYVAWTYWLAVSIVAIFGTMAADALHGAGLPYLRSTLAFGVALAAIFVAWYWSEGTLSIHSINTTRREVFYWATVIVTFALGTAAGDMTASTFRWGYFTSGVVFTVAIVAVGVVHFIVTRTVINKDANQSTSVIAFWLAYILTRPLGASFADWMGAPRGRGGVGWGDGMVSVVLFVVIAAFVAYLAVTQEDVQADDPLEAGRQ